MEFKKFPDFSPLEITHKALFDKAYANLPPAESDLVFSNLFAWQGVLGYRFSALGNFLFIHYKEDNTIVFLPPLLLSEKISYPDFARHFSEAAKFLEGYCAGQGMKPVFRFYPEVYVRNVEKEGFDITQEREFFDYVYKRKNLAALAGQKFSPKRNLISQFKRKYEYVYENLSKNNLKAVYSLLPEDKKSAEFQVVEKLLANFTELGLSGGLITVKGQPVAATIATIVPNFMYEKACYNTAVIHFEKALTDFKGSYQIINQLFAQSLPEAVAGINREEDLGIEGLRKAKMSYNPDKMIKKYKLAFK